ncbi:Glutathione peroxidase [Portunus trituberculatus]|uniref:Glutathione peroxidase n=2 Tax=Portunus trituberculatus TaxID=210409 RepID=A0A5B7CTM8_PORTR|nr:Glutathione peroxidase [Portunus trituberculatus]
MNALAEYYVDEDFVILGFPCNQFNLQEPGVTASEIMNGIKYVRPGGGFEPKMTLFKKTDVNGKDENSIYTFLKSACPYTDSTFSSSLFYEPLRVNDIYWNFEKFLIGKNGKPYSRFHPSVITSGKIKEDINFLLNA